MESTLEKRWYWLAINGASCAACAAPLPTTVVVSPQPEQLLGFRTREEQVKVQQFLLTAPIEEVTTFMGTLPNRIASGDVAYMRPDDPEPSTRGQTIWACSPRK